MAEGGDGDGIGVGVEGGDDGVAGVVRVECGVEEVWSSDGEFGLSIYGLSIRVACWRRGRQRRGLGEGGEMHAQLCVGVKQGRWRDPPFRPDDGHKCQVAHAEDQTPSHHPSEPLA